MGGGGEDTQCCQGGMELRYCPFSLLEGKNGHRKEERADADEEEKPSACI